jgi:hypothetical protein
MPEVVKVRLGIAEGGLPLDILVARRIVNVSA